MTELFMFLFFHFISSSFHFISLIFFKSIASFTRNHFSRTESGFSSMQTQIAIWITQFCTTWSESRFKSTSGGGPVYASGLRFNKQLQRVCTF